MAIINSSNAIPAKARAKYGKRLREKDYKILISCKTVAEVVSYLKFNTHYSSALTKVNEYDVHRGQIETILRQKLFYDFDSLCRYEMSDGSRFSRFVLRRYEIMQIIHFLTLLNSDKAGDYIFIMPEYFNSHTEIDLVSLINAKSYEQLILAVKGSPYEEILADFSPDGNGRADIAAIEHRLYVFMYTELYEAIEKDSVKSEKAELKKMFDTLIDFMNYAKIYRLHTFYRKSPQEIEKSLLPFGSVNLQQVENLCGTDNITQFLDALLKTPARRVLKNIHYNFTGEIPTRVRYNISKRNMFFSASPVVVLLSYVFVTNTELLNVVNIIEGVRYGLKPEEIDNLLIYR